VGDSKNENGLTHIDAEGRARMVDVGGKPDTKRTARARGRISMAPETLILLARKAIPKGDVLAVARVAGIMAAKETSRLIPMCHPLNLTGIAVDFTLDTEDSALVVEAAAGLTGKTGVEMEALTAVSVALLTVYDMCKAVDKGMIISDIRLLEKLGGKSG
jgi:cyclic pyranopterin phosphate synthase